MMSLTVRAVAILAVSLLTACRDGDRVFPTVTPTPLPPVATPSAPAAFPVWRLVRTLRSFEGDGRCAVEAARQLEESLPAVSLAIVTQADGRTFFGYDARLFPTDHGVGFDGMTRAGEFSGEGFAYDAPPCAGTVLSSGRPLTLTGRFTVDAREFHGKEVRHYREPGRAVDLTYAFDWHAVLGG